MPDGAVLGGNNHLRQDIYICRTKFNGGDMIGKVNPGHHVCYIPVNEKEVTVHNNYQTLVIGGEGDGRASTDGPCWMGRRCVQADSCPWYQVGRQ